MPSRRLRPLGALIALILWPVGQAEAAPPSGLAARAVAEAKSMPAGRERDVALREISRNLRHADRGQAIAAAAAMSDDRELRTFGPSPDTPVRRVAASGEQSDDGEACQRFVERLTPGRADAADDRRIRGCFFMDAPPGFIAPPYPPFRLFLLAADALPPSSTKAELLYMATWIPDRPDGGAREAVRRLRALVPLLAGDTRREAVGWLDTISVDLIEGRPDDAIARIRRGFAPWPASTTVPADDPATQARSLIVDLLAARDLDRAVTVTNLLPPSTDCAAIGDGLTGVMTFVVPTQDGAVVAAYMARLEASGTLARLCPRGLGGEIAAEVWLQAGDDDRALAAATRSGKPLVLARTRSTIVEHRLTSGDLPGAGSVLRTAAAAPVALDAGNPFDRAAAARERVRLIHLLARAGEVAAAERLASAFPGPGWRGFADAVIVATTDGGRDADGGGPALDLPEVAADH